MAELTHIDARGQARMVDVSGKAETHREAVARGSVHMQPATMELVQKGGIAKGDVLAVARVAGIMAAKRTAELVPMCHPLGITGSRVDCRWHEAAAVLEIEAVIKTEGKTGVEMEALTAVAVAALTVYDMCKAVDRGMSIDNIHLVEKTGGKSGTYRKEGEKPWDAS